MKKGDLVIDRCVDPKYCHGLGILMSECDIYYTDGPPWWNVFYFKLGIIVPESPLNIEVINEV